MTLKGQNYLGSPGGVSVNTTSLQHKSRRKTLWRTKDRWRKRLQAKEPGWPLEADRDTPCWHLDCSPGILTSAFWAPEPILSSCRFRPRRLWSFAPASTGKEHRHDRLSPTHRFWQVSLTSFSRRSPLRRHFGTECVTWPFLSTWPSTVISRFLCWTLCWTQGSVIVRTRSFLCVWRAHF